MINQLAKKLRMAADLLDELLSVDRPTKHETAETAKKIKATLKKKSTLKGRKYKAGTHWTQTPRGRKIMAQRAKDSHKARLKLVAHG